MDVNGCDIVETPARYLRNLGFHFDEDDWNKVGFQNTVKKWIVYFGLKYGNIESISVERCDHVLDSPPSFVTRSFEEPLKKAITNMKQLDDYQFMLYPLTEGVARAIDDNSDIELHTLCLYVNNDTYQQQLSVLQYSNISKTVTSLIITRMTMDLVDEEFNNEGFSNAIVETCKQMPNLVSLRIYGNILSKEPRPQFLANILQQVHHVKVLDISRLSITRGSDKIDFD